MCTCTARSSTHKPWHDKHLVSTIIFTYFYLQLCKVYIFIFLAAVFITLHIFLCTSTDSYFVSHKSYLTIHCQYYFVKGNTGQPHWFFLVSTGQYWELQGNTRSVLRIPIRTARPSTSVQSGPPESQLQVSCTTFCILITYQLAHCNISLLSGRLI